MATGTGIRAVAPPPRRITAADLRAVAPGPPVDRAELGAWLSRTFGAPGYRPPLLPAVALEVMELSQRPDVQFPEVVRVLERDPVLAGRVLSLAQSAALAGRSPILSLHQALIRLGLRTLSEVVMQAALHMKVFRAPGFEAPMERLLRHSTATAHLARLVCRRTAVDGEYAFLCGLLADVGFAAGLLVVAEDPALRAHGFDALASALDDAHEEASAVLARLWKLPEAICAVVGSHHALALGGRPSALHAAIVVAEQLAWEAGFGLVPPPPGAGPLVTRTPEPPLDGIDVNWSGLVDEARQLLRMDELALCAARAEAFALLAGLFPAVDARADRR